MGGDLIVAVDGKELTREHDLADEISGHGAGEKVELTVLRDGERRTHQRGAGPPPRRLRPVVRGFACFRVTCRKWWRSPR